ncbi:hypothetical protein MBLNU459_g6501t1 [Dothideomycetes sp. NU459]
MQYTTYAAVLAAIARISVASPVDIVGRSTFSVQQVAVPAEQRTPKKAPVHQLLKVYQKYAHKGAVAPSAVVAAAATQTGQVTATPESDDSEYLCPVKVGSDTLNLDFDTGSADLWVFSNLLSSSKQSGHSIYTPGSTASKESGETWSISYGDGSGASGVVYSDKVVVGGVTATSQAVEAATSISSAFVSDTDSDGLLGLAFSSINTVTPNAATTFFDTVKSTLAKKLFTVDLKKGAAGYYDFGYIDSSKYTGSITYVDVDTSNGFWEFTASGYSVGSGATKTLSIDAIADTGTTLLLVPDSVVTAYYKKVTGSSYSSSQGGYIFPCSATLPDFSAVIGGTKFTVPGSYMNYASVDSSNCYGGIQSDSGVGFSIFGDIFLKSQFVVFSATTSTPQLGFAAQ